MQDKYEYICVLDFEATCDDVKKRSHEIIEYPSVLLKWNEKSKSLAIHSIRNHLSTVKIFIFRHI